MPLSSLLLVSALLLRQQVPEGVRYQRAPEALNKRAQAKLEAFFKASPVHAQYSVMSQEVLICMPGMWQSISKGAPMELQSAKRATFHVPGPGDPQEFEGRLLKTPHEQMTFWKVLKGRCGQKRPTIRKANANELKYYWALIPYDIEEPVFVADFGPTHVLFDFGGSKQDPKVLAVEVIGGFK